MAQDDNASGCRAYVSIIAIRNINADVMNTFDMNTPLYIEKRDGDSCLNNRPARYLKTVKYIPHKLCRFIIATYALKMGRLKRQLISTWHIFLWKHVPCSRQVALGGSYDNSGFFHEFANMRALLCCEQFGTCTIFWHNILIICFNRLWRIYKRYSLLTTWLMFD